MKSVISPFKFLDAYTKKDRDVFFGREAEIDLLYEFVYKTNLVLVYGQSGTGKTSLIQCGLSNKFKETDWFDIHVRRKNNINENLHEELRKNAITSFEPDFSLVDKVDSIFLDYFKPIYLIFDQFEELYILGTAEERKKFIVGIKEIINCKVNCTVLIVMREEYIAHLYDFEKQIPQLFDNRLRVEPMSFANVGNVISSSTERFDIQLNNPDKTIPEIIEKISDQKSGIQLSYLQIYLDRLYREAAAVDSTVIFDTKLVNEVGSINKVLTEFLDNQARRIQTALQREHSFSNSKTVQLILNAFVTLDGTKKPLQKEELVIPNVTPAQIEFCLVQLDKARILRLADNYYELSHDTIAMHIAEQREGDEIALLEVEKLIQDRFDAFNTTSTFLNPKELQLIEVYEEKLENQNKLTSELWAFVKKSKTSSFKKRRLRYALISMALLVLTVTTVIALVMQRRAVVALDQLKATEELKQIEEQKAYLKYEEHIEKGYELLNNSDFIAAQTNFETALNLAKDYDINSNGKRAKEGLEESAMKSVNADEFYSLIKEGDDLFELGGIKYADALVKYHQARELDLNNDLIDDKIRKVESQLPEVFEDLKSKGLKHFKVKGYKYALQEFYAAKRIDPDDVELNQLINSCLKNLKK